MFPVSCSLSKAWWAQWGWGGEVPASSQTGNAAEGLGPVQEGGLTLGLVILGEKELTEVQQNLHPELFTLVVEIETGHALGVTCLFRLAEGVSVDRLQAVQDATATSHPKAHVERCRLLISKLHGTLWFGLAARDAASLGM
jgi:hypothetical protein